MTAGGGKVLGQVRQPLGTADFSSALLQAQSSGAQVLALANTGADVINSVKQAKEFGLTQSMKVTALFLQLSDVHGLGLQEAQGLLTTEAWYWNLNDGTRAFAKRFAEKMNGRMPTANHAGVYSVDPGLSARGEGGQHDRRRQGGRLDEAASERRSGVRPGRNPGGRAGDPSDVPVPGEDAGREQRRPTITTTCCRRSRRTRRSGR